MIKYSVRHYAHAQCGLQRWGAEFFDRLHPWQVQQFPYLAAVKCGLQDELIKRNNKITELAELIQRVGNPAA